VEKLQADLRDNKTKLELSQRKINPLIATKRYLSLLCALSFLHGQTLTLPCLSSISELTAQVDALNLQMKLLTEERNRLDSIPFSLPLLTPID